MPLLTHYGRRQLRSALFRAASCRDATPETIYAATRQAARTFAVDDRDLLAVLSETVYYADLLRLHDRHTTSPAVLTCRDATEAHA